MTHWNSFVMKFVRTICFIPLGFAALLILHETPPYLLDFLGDREFNQNWLSVLLLLFLVFATPTFLAFYLYLVGGCSFGVCRYVAPWPKVCTVIFGTLYSFEAVLAVLVSRSHGEMIYEILFAVLVVAGIVFAYHDAKEKVV